MLTIYLLPKWSIIFLKDQRHALLIHFYSSLRYVGSSVMYYVMKESKELSKVSMIQLIKTMRLTDITWNKEKNSIYHQNWLFSIKEGVTITVEIKKKKKRKENEIGMTTLIKKKKQTNKTKVLIWSGAWAWMSGQLPRSWSLSLCP